MHAVESMMLVIGPDMAVFPTVSLVPDPAIITAPGEMSLKGRNIEISVMRAPCRVSLNSAHRLKCCAENLWASSWRRNDAVKAADRIAVFRCVDPDAVVRK